jgi:NAD(P)-dependent dehydrogenase (short-subunit alcohol dehydrogenase family)
MTEQVWFVTGATSGFGRAITEAAAAAGDTVIAAGRRTQRLRELETAHPKHVEALPLDVTDLPAARTAVDDVIARHGRIDVLVNSAGHGQVGAAEETTEEELRSLFEIHFFAAAELTRAVLPSMRARRSGAIVQLSSMGGMLTYPGYAAYCATKFALEGWSQALAAEVAPLGIRVLIVEPGAFRTELHGSAGVESAELADYADTVGPTRQTNRGYDGRQPGDPAKAAAAIRAALAADEPPAHLALGADAVDEIRKHLTSLLDGLDRWEWMSRGTDIDS